MDKLNLKIKNCGKINEANIEINKINVVGGVNASGKSTLSKLLYCYLKTILLKDTEYPIDLLKSEICSFMKEINIKGSTFDEMKGNYDKIYEDLKSDNNCKITLERIDNLIKIMEDDDGNSLFSFLMMRYLLGELLYSLNGEHMFYGDSFECSYDDEGFVFNEKSSAFSDNENSFKSKDHLKFSDVVYLDTISVIDVINLKNGANYHVKELEELLTNNENRDIFHDIINAQSIEIEHRIDDVLNGGCEIRNNDLSNSMSFVSYSGSHINLKNVSSGMKQLSLIKLLLSCNKLSSHSFLIIDEPEVNLHPKWQFQYAEILVILAKELDITIYLNSHSPMFIESIAAFAEFYEMQDEVNYYLTDMSNVAGKYDFIKIPPNKLYKIYNNLGNVYDLIDKLRLEKHLGE